MKIWLILGDIISFGQGFQNVLQRFPQRVFSLDMKQKYKETHLKKKLYVCNFFCSQIKLKERYVWTKRESTEAGSSLGELVDQVSPYLPPVFFINNTSSLSPSFMISALFPLKLTLLQESLKFYLSTSTDDQ